MRELVIYYYYFIQFFKSRAVYKVDFIFGLISNVGVALFSLMFVLFLMDGEQITSIGDWSRSEVLFVYAFSMLSFAMFNIVAPNLFMFGDRYVVEGQFDRVLLRPLNSLGQVVFESFNLDAIGTFILGLFLLLSSANELGIQFNALDVVWVAVSIFSGSIILLSIFMVLASLSFHFDDRLGLGAPVFSLITFARYPLPIFNKIIQFILSFIIPFGFVAFYPATHFFSKEEFYFYCYATPLVAFICLLIAGSLWKIGVKNYTSTGT